MSQSEVGFTFIPCRTGKHNGCEVRYRAPKGTYGGSFCNCECHTSTPKVKEVKEPTRQKPTGGVPTLRELRGF